MTLQGTPIKYHHKYRFKVQIDNFAHARFQECSALEMEIAKIEMWEGGSLTAHKEPGRLTYSDITLQRGITQNEDCYNWLKQVVSAHRDVGRVMNRIKRNVEIVQFGRNGQTRRRWVLEECFPVKFVAGEWNNTQDEANIEQLTLTFKLARQPSD